jgi:hypothetical protein
MKKQEQKAAKVAAGIRRSSSLRADNQKKVGVMENIEARSGEESKSNNAGSMKDLEHQSDATYKTKQSKKSVKSNKSGGRSEKSEPR